MRKFIWPKDGHYLKEFFRKTPDGRVKDFEKEYKLSNVPNSGFGRVRRDVARELGISFVSLTNDRKKSSGESREKRSYTKRNNTSNTYVTIYEDELPKTFMQSKGMEIVDEVTKAISKQLGTNIQILKMADPSGIEVRMAI